MDKQFDATEIIFSHIDVVFTNLDLIHAKLAKGEPLEALFSSKIGSEVSDFIKDLGKNKAGLKISNNLKKFYTENEDKIINVTECSCYCLDWLMRAIQLLKVLCDNSLELDIRWNYIFSIRFCQIFVAANKVIFFINHHPYVRYCLALSGFMDGPSQNKKIRASKSIKEYSTFVKACITSPFQFLQIGKGIIQFQLGQLLSQIGPFLIQVIGEWPLLNWEDFTVFNRRPKQQSETTLPNMEHIILSNLQTFTDTALFFSLNYPDFISSHPQFNSLMAELLSECDSILLAKTTTLSYDDLLNCYKTHSQGLSEEYRKAIRQRMKIKYEMSHKQRLAHLIVLLSDIVNLIESEAAYLPILTYEITALCGFAYYELSTVLLHTESKPTIEILSIVDVIVRIVRVYLKYERPVMRFFVYNLGSVDLCYFSQLFDQNRDNNSENQAMLMMYLGDLGYQLQQNVDLQDFDSGIRYDFTGFIYTHGRILHYYNLLKMTKHISYLQVFFEHLETIRLHMTFAQSPIHAFLTYCPIHTIWRSIYKFEQYFKSPPGNVHQLGSIVTLFSFFNYDLVSLSSLPNDADMICKRITQARADLASLAYSLITDTIENSPMMKLTNQNRYEQLFNPNEFIPSAISFSINFFENDTKFAKPIWEIKELFQQLPSAIEFNNKQFEICEYIANSVTDNLTALLFKTIIPNAYSIDAKFSIATQLLWPIYTVLNAPFAHKLFVAKFAQSESIEGTSIIDLICKIKETKVLNEPVNPPPQQQQPQSKSKTPMVIENPIMKKQTIINVFVDAINNFVTNGYLNTPYLPHSKAFVQNGEEQFLSFDSLKTLMFSLGPIAGYHIDHVLIQRAAFTMAEIHSLFGTTTTALSKGLNSFNTNGDIDLSQYEGADFQKAGNAMIRLGVILTLRQLVREAIATVIEKTMPGFTEIVTAAYLRSSDSINTNKYFLIEFATSLPCYYFLSESLNSAHLKVSSDSLQFFLFLAVILGHSQWHKMLFDPNNEFMTNNLHLFPIAVDGFINLFSKFAMFSESRDIESGMNFFFKILRQIIFKIEKLPNVDKKTIKSYEILADMFPRQIKNIEYGLLAESFPEEIIMDAYRHVTKVSPSEKTTERKKAKGKKK